LNLELKTMMSANEREENKKKLGRGIVFLEWGSGGSTEEFAVWVETEGQQLLSWSSAVGIKRSRVRFRTRERRKGFRN